MAGTHVTLDSKAFLEALKRHAGNLDVQAGLIVAEVGEQVARKARALAPVDTGTLRRSIKSTPGRDAQGPYSDVTVDPFYASFREFGTSADPAHPFMRPAAEEAPAAIRKLSRRLG